MKLDMTGMFPYILALGLTALIMLLAVLIYYSIKRNKDQVSYDEQLEELLQDDFTPDLSGTKVSLSKRWNTHWGGLFQDAGIGRYSVENNAAGRDMLLLGVGSGVVGTALTGNIIVGLLLPVAAIFAVSMIFKMKSNKKADSLNLQLPGFLASVKSSLHAADSNERAMLKSIDAMPSPLYDELQIVKHRLLANGTFSESLQELKETTTSRDLRFLSSCMIQASLSGANMIEQIDTIQNSLEERRRINDEIKKAERTVQPAILLSTLVIPGLFLGSYFMDATAREFWFVDILSWAAIGVTIGLYIIGMLLTRKQINKIRDM